MSLVVFRVDAARGIGGGHVMRCLALADAFTENGWQIGFASTRETFETIAALDDASFKRLAFTGKPEHEAARLAEHWPAGADVLVVDHYGRDAEFERACRPWARRILIIDDLGNRRHDADVLVDGGAAAEAYRDLVPPACLLLTGPRYAIVGSAFRNARAASLARRAGRPVEKILVSFGQTDTANATKRALNAIQKSEFKGSVAVVLGGAAPHLSEIRTLETDKVRLHTDVRDMADMMSNADLAIGAGGVTAWERCCVGLPSIVAELADNQRGIIRTIVAAGAALDVGQLDAGLEARIVQQLNAVLENGASMTALSAAAAALVDGAGGYRILEALN